MLDDAAVIGTSNVISLFGVVFAGSDLTQIWDIDFKRRMGLWLANMNCLLTVWNNEKDLTSWLFNRIYFCIYAGMERHTFTFAYFLQNLQSIKNCITLFLGVNTTETLMFRFYTCGARFLLILHLLWQWKEWLCLCCSMKDCLIPYFLTKWHCLAHVCTT